MRNTPPSALAHYQEVLTLQGEAVGAARRSWAQVNPNAIRSSWQAAAPSLVSRLRNIQQRAALAGATYGALTLADQGTYIAPEELTDPDAFTGWMVDDDAPEWQVPLSPVVESATVRPLSLIGDGMAPQQALISGRDALLSVVMTAVADSARQAGGVDLAARPQVGYVRMLNPPSCSRCVVLAGRFYRWNTGFQRHPRCFPAGVVVSGPSSEAATRRWYEGELVVLTTASGQELPLTGNHPVLTRRGWLPAHLLREGDEVLRSTRPEGATPLVVPDHHQVPSRIEDVWSAFSVSGLERVPSTAEDFHGDGVEGEVDVVLADGALVDDPFASLFEVRGELALPGRLSVPTALELEGVADLLDRRDAAQPGGLVGLAGLSLPLLGAEGRISRYPGLGHAAAVDARVAQALRDHAAADAVLSREGVLGGAGYVGGDDLLARDVSSVPPRWDAPGSEFSVETRGGYAQRGLDLLNRLTGQVEPDRLVKVERRQWSGHVYSLTSSEGWHTANSLIVSNCDCVHVPSAAKSTAAAEAEGLITDPYAYFNDLPKADQDRLFTPSGAQAIRDGGDIYQVVNARRGIARGGRKGGRRASDARRAWTREGTTKRGAYVKAGGTARYRLTPEGIYSRASSREEALDLLREYGYILPAGQVPGGSIRGANYQGFGQMGAGGRRRAATNAVLDASATGERNPNSRYTMTAAERRVADARWRWDLSRMGIDPTSSGATELRGGAAIGGATRPSTPEMTARYEREYRYQLARGGQIYRD